MTAPLFVTLCLATLLLIVLGRRRLGFASQRPDGFAATTPVFDIRHVLAGPLLSEGVIHGPTGRLAARFVARMQGDWDGTTGRLAEDFHYAGGARQRREWRIVIGEDGAFTATADDIIGIAKGRQVGAAVRLRYRIRLSAASGGHVLDVTDWMYLMENGTIMNRSEMRKFGIRVAELVATIRPGGALHG